MRICWSKPRLQRTALRAAAEPPSRYPVTLRNAIVLRSSFFLCDLLAVDGCRQRDRFAPIDATPVAREQQTEPSSDRVELLRSRIGRRLLMILVDAPDLEQNTLRIVGYGRDGRSLIPVFDSEEALRAAAAGTDVDGPVWAIDRRLLVSTLKGDEMLILNPDSDSELRFSADELRRAFPEPLDPNEKGWAKP